MVTSHEDYMQMALEEAQAARARDEVPVGVVLVSAGGAVIARASNRVIADCDPTAHAEILALRRAAKKVMNYRLIDTTLYATIEPCVMCMGAVIHARIRRVVFGAADPKWGACGSLVDFAGGLTLNHRVEVLGGICEAACRDIMVEFFRSRRKVLRPA